jgi:hypothetical protein
MGGVPAGIRDSDRRVGARLWVWLLSPLLRYRRRDINNGSGFAQWASAQFSLVRVVWNFCLVHRIIGIAASLLGFDAPGLHFENEGSDKYKRHQDIKEIYGFSYQTPIFYSYSIKN